MYDTRKEEVRALDVEEREMVTATHHPEIQELSDAELAKLVSRLRARRDRAQKVARQRRREMRGKAAPRGVEPSRADDGSKLKAEVLAAAMRRLNSEVRRRRNMRARMALIASQQHALEMKQSLHPAHEGFNSRTAHHGMRRNDNSKVQKIGSAMEVGRVSQFMKVAQAKKDAR